MQWASENYDINEIYFVSVQFDATTAECLYSSLKISLISLGIPFGHCRGQSYDEARNFQGCISVVAKRFENKSKSAISVHCLAHCMNRCLQGVARDSKCRRKALNCAMEFM